MSLYHVYSMVSHLAVRSQTMLTGLILGCYPLVQPSKVQLWTFELLDNKIVQKCTLNYFIIQKFNPGHVQKILFVGVELLDNEIVQPKKSIKNTHFYGLNYSIIQEFNPNKKYILYMGIIWHTLLWIQQLSNIFLSTSTLWHALVQQICSVFSVFLFRRYT